MTSLLYTDIFESLEMREIFSDKNTVQTFLDIEKTLAKVQGDLGIIPQEASKLIQSVCIIENIDIQKYQKEVSHAGFPIVPLLNQIVEKANNKLVEYIHFGATTQDIMDTAVVLQIKAAFEIIENDLEMLIEQLSITAKEHINTLMVGRSQLQQALPITFGYKTANWLSSIKRHQQRLAEIRPRVLVLQFGGAVGTLASLKEDGYKVQAGLSKALGLKMPEMAWHTSRDTLAETISFLGLITGSLAKMATDILLMTQTEVGELSEPSASGRGESSTMPQKKNPILSQKIIVSAKMVKQQVASMLEAMVQDHERASGPWAQEWLIVPDTFKLTGGALIYANKLLDGLVIHKDRMLRNLQITNGFILSEALMIELAPSIGKQKAHDLLHQLAMKATETKATLLEVVKEEPLIMNSISSKRLDELMNPYNYLGMARSVVEKIAKVSSR